MIPGFLKSVEAANLLGLSYPKFRIIQHLIPSVQLHKRGPRLYKLKDLQQWEKTRLEKAP